MSALRTCDDLRPLLGGYVLEALEPDEMAAVREHLPNCPACSAEHASLAGLPALLDLAAPLDAPDEPLSPAFEEALLDRFARDREAGREPESERAPRRRPRLPKFAWTRPRVAVASGLLAAALTFATMTALDDDPPSQPAASRNYVVQLKAGAAAPAGGRVSGRVALYRVRGGTGVHLWASGPPQRPQARLRGAVREGRLERERRHVPRRRPRAASRRGSRPPRASGNTTASASSTGTSADTPRTS